MPLATTCKLGKREVHIDEALQLRDDALSHRRPYPEFRCLNCGELVQPQKEGATKQAAHFEHKRDTNSPDCPLRTSR